ncbi:hypothetical protein [Streptomyces sp. NPDC020141]|uniref:hypothetical protein n=1 Tax=Streptomyces sp. NPDC020141 TaxID=3365065 RepID=UPI003787C80D
MADTATAAPESTPDTPENEGVDTGEHTLATTGQQSPEPPPEAPRASRGRPRAIPLIVHGTNASGIAAGVAYAVAGVPGLAAAGAAGAAVGAAALAGRKKRSKISAARKAAASNRSGGTNSPGGSGRGGGAGAGKGGLLGRGGGRGGRTGSGGTGRGTGSGAGPGTGGRGRGPGSGGGGRGGTRPTGNGAGQGSAGGGRGPGNGGRHTAPGPNGRGSGNGPGSGAGPGKKGRGLGGLLGKGGRGKGGGGLNSPGANTPQGTGSLNKGGKNAGGGRKNAAGGGKNAAGPQSRSGKAWQTVKGWMNKGHRKMNTGGGSSGSGTGSAGGSGSGSTAAPKTKPASTRRGRLWSKAKNKARAWAGKLRRTKKKTPGASGTSGAGGAGKAGPASGRLYRMRRLAARKIGHWARCTGAGFLAGLGGLLTLPLGLVWGMWRMVTRHRDPLGAFAFPVRIAGRIWRFFFRRSKARHDKEAKADQLNLTVNDPRKDTDPVSGTSLTSGTAVLDGNNSKFALAMRATHASYTGYRPRSMMEVAAEYAGLPNGIRATAMALQQMAVNSDQKYPCSKRAVAKLAEAAQRLVNAGGRAGGMVTLFRAAHAFDIERILSPRTNEWMWNVTPTGGDAPAGAMFMPGRIESGCVLMAVLYRTFEPVHMMQVGTEYQGMKLGLEALADSVAALYERTRDAYPVDDRVTSELRMLVSMIGAAADDAAVAAQLFLEDHAREISHNINPRKGPAAEGMWNTPR